MDQIIIHHAYDGFLYAPIFLARRLNLFPANCELKSARGDAEAIQPLCDEPINSNIKNWFAICDPLSDHVKTTVPRGNERVCLVGGIISKAPVWLYNINPKIPLLKNEEELRQHKDKIKKIVTYPDNTTGYLFGERIRRKFLEHIPHVTAVPFGEEFNQVDQETLVVTSDILRVLKEDTANNQILEPNKRTNPIIFHYPEAGPSETTRFLFTGILTRRQIVLKENLDVLLAVIGAIKKAIHYLSQEVVTDEHIGHLIDQFKPQLLALGIIQQNEQGAYLRNVIFQMKKQGIFWEMLIPDKTAFTNAESEWVKIRPASVIDLNQYIQTVPSILLSPQRFTDFPDLQNAVIDRTPPAILVQHPKIASLFCGTLATPQTQAAVLAQIPKQTLVNDQRVQAIIAQNNTRPSYRPIVDLQPWKKRLLFAWPLTWAALCYLFLDILPKIDPDGITLLGCGLFFTGIIVMGFVGAKISTEAASGNEESLTKQIVLFYSIAGVEVIGTALHLIHFHT